MFDRDLLPFIAGINPTIMWIAVTVGVLLYVIGYFAGGRLTMSRIVTCTVVVTVIGVLSLPLPMIAYRVIKEQFNIVTVQVEKDGSITKLTPKTSPPNTPPTGAQATESSTNDNQENIPVSFQVLTLVMYIVWTGFLIGMGILFYETMIVTTDEADRK